MRKTIHCIAMLCVALAALPAGAVQLEAPDRQLQTIGEAKDQRSGELLYRELYFCNADALLCSVEYRDPQGELISRKALDYTQGPHVPRVAIEDFRHGRTEALERKPQESLVVDAGFDNFVRSRWQQLSTGERVTFQFLVVGAKKPYNMKAQRNDDADCEPHTLCLTVEIDSWLLGLVAPAIELVYDREARQLLRFVGTSNIRSTDDKTQQVDIAYRYDNLAVDS